MSVCRIVGAGECKKTDFKKQNGDLIIAADGGCVYLEKAGIVPDIIIGDFDSLGYVPEGNEVVKLNPVKDITDMDAAVNEGIKKVESISAEEMQKITGAMGMPGLF